jgi:hypothetical protein
MSRIDELERRIATLEQHLGLGDTQPYMPQVRWPETMRAGDCGCLPGVACGNAACPRALRVTATAPIVAFTTAVVK